MKYVAMFFLLCSAFFGATLTATGTSLFYCHLFSP